MLLSAAGSMRFWLYTAPADMLKGFDGLAGLVRNGLGDDLLRGDVFVFISRSRVQIKLLHWDGSVRSCYASTPQHLLATTPCCRTGSTSARRPNTQHVVARVDTLHLANLSA
jgi:hypothetical protein